MRKIKSKEQIREAAQALFVKYGFDKTSIEDIAKRARMAKRSVYNHFSNKEDIFCDSVREELDYVRGQLKPIISEKFEELEQLKQFLLKRAELIAGAKTFRLAMRKAESQNGFKEVQGYVDTFESWEHNYFSAVWRARTSLSGNAPKAESSSANAFADMLLMSLKGLDHAFFVENKYEEYKQSYSYLVNLIINSVKNNLVFVE